jgi:tetratricopeptide (TPR) repeat protein
MLQISFRVLVMAMLLSVALPVFAQRDRDTYNPSNQVFEVAGEVHLAGNSEAARNVSVRLEKFSGGLIDQMSTDNRGRFRFTNLQRNFYKVVINTPGYNPTQQEADLTVLFKIYLVFTLSQAKAPAVSELALGGEVIDARVPPEAREEFVQGRAALAKKSYPEAITHLRRATTLYAEFFDAHFLLATAFTDTREWAEAETALNRALEIKPNSSMTLVSLGEIYWRQKRFADAERTLLAGLKLDEKSWHGQFTLGRLYLEMGDVAKAGPPIGKTLQLKPDFAEAHLLAGNILLKVSQPQRALLEYQEYLRLAPKGEFAPQARELVQKLQKQN